MISDICTFLSRERGGIDPGCGGRALLAPQLERIVNTERERERERGRERERERERETERERESLSR